MKESKYKDRYKRSIGTLSKQEHMRLVDSRVCVVGCGGLGGYVIELLGRMGVGELTAIDYDTFEEHNLNRQLLSIENNIGMSKARAAVERMRDVNSEVKVRAVEAALDECNSLEMVKGHDVVVDALDDIGTRMLLQKSCEKVGVPLVHGAIAGWYGQVCTIFPGDRTLERIYSAPDAEGIEKETGNPSFSPAHIASLQVSEAIKVLTGKGELLRNKVLFIDMLSNEYEVIEF